MNTRMRRHAARRGMIAALVAAGLALASCSDDSGGGGDDGGGNGGGDGGDGDSQVLEALESGYPDGPITLWAGFAPGHVNDVLNRTVADIATDYSPVRVTTDTHEAGPGVNYALVDEFMTTLPRFEEGYDLHAANWAAMGIAPYDNELVSEFEVDYLRPLVGLYTVPYAYAVRPDSEFESLEDVVAFAEENPGELNYTAGQAGSRGQLESILFLEEAGVEMTFVPTDGVDESAQVVLGGGADVIMTGLHTLDLDSFRVLAISGTERLDIVPDAPTMTELGYEGPTMSMDAYALIGYGLAPEVPDDVAEWLTELMTRVIEDPRFAAAYEYANVQLVDADQVRADQVDTLDAVFPIMEELGLNVRDR